MSRKKVTSNTKRRRKTRLQTGVVGLTLSLVSAACAESATADTAPVAMPVAAPTVNLYDEEIEDVSLATFYLFDKESPGEPRTGALLAAKGSGSSRSQVSPQGSSSPPGSSGRGCCSRCYSCNRCRSCRR